jgi:hypothetical protein
VRQHMALMTGQQQSSSSQVAMPPDWPLPTSGHGQSALVREQAPVGGTHFQPEVMEELTNSTAREPAPVAAVYE